MLGVGYDQASVFCQAGIGKTFKRESRGNIRTVAAGPSPSRSPACRVPIRENRSTHEKCTSPLCLADVREEHREDNHQHQIGLDRFIGEAIPDPPRQAKGGWPTLVVFLSSLIVRQPPIRDFQRVGTCEACVAQGFCPFCLALDAKIESKS